MLKRSLSYVLAFATSYSVAYALTRYDFVTPELLDISPPRELDLERPFMAMRPPNAQRLVDDLFEEPRILVPPMVIEGRVPRTWRRRRARRLAARVTEPESELQLPDTLDRWSVGSILASMSKGVQRCHDSGAVPGRVNLRLAIFGETGRVAHATVDADTSTARCIRQLARQLRFPRFTRATLTVHYPYDLR
jgi:hypothetical protein